jgi:adenylate kinase family enzyme
LKPIERKPAEAEPISHTSPEDTTPVATRLKTDEPPSPVTEDKWVRPSEVSTDRMIHTRPSSAESELEKARKAFARAEEVGIDEEGEGIVETRMLRASEVKELLEGPGVMGAQPEAITDDTEGIPLDTVAPIQPPSAEDMEQQILGEWSTLVDRESEPVPESVSTETSPSPVRMSAADSTGFSSARYAESPTEPVEESATSIEVETPSAPEPEKVHAMEKLQEWELSAEDVITCPHCKSIITIDGYEYPDEIYSAMGQARLKQARYLIVQGKELDARNIVKIARVLFEKANDGDGLAQIEQIAANLNTSD